MSVVVMSCLSLAIIGKINAIYISSWRYRARPFIYSCCYSISCVPYHISTGLHDVTRTSSVTLETMQQVVSSRVWRWTADWINVIQEGSGRWHPLPHGKPSSSLSARPVCCLIFVEQDHLVSWPSVRKAELDMGPFFLTQSNPIHIYMYLGWKRTRKLSATNYDNAGFY